MFHQREVQWPAYTHDATVVVDTRNGDRRLLAQSPIPMEYMEPGYNDDGVAESDGYSTPHEEFDDEDGAETVGVEPQTPSIEPEENEPTTERQFFSTPCGQTYWVDGDFYLYTNQTVQIPIGYWCNHDQCVYLNDGLGDTTDDDEEDEYDPPPTPPPIYEESNSVQGSPVPMDTEHDSEVEGEHIVIASSQ